MTCIHENSWNRKKKENGRFWDKKKVGLEKRGRVPSRGWRECEVQHTTKF